MNLITLTRALKDAPRARAWMRLSGKEFRARHAAWLAGEPLEDADARYMDPVLKYHAGRALLSPAQKKELSDMVLREEDYSEKQVGINEPETLTGHTHCTLSRRSRNAGV